MFSVRERSERAWIVVCATVAFAMCAPAASSWSSADASVDAPLVFRAGMPYEVYSVNPFTAYMYADTLVLELMYDTLTGVNPDFTPGPRLAQSWFCDSSGLVWTYNLTSDALWHDGEPVTADDVVFTYDLIMTNPDECALWVDYLHDVTDIEAVSDYVVQVTTGVPRGDMPGDAIPILPEHLWSSVPGDYLDGVDVFDEYYFPDGPVGSGPFALVDYDPIMGLTRFASFAQYHGGCAGFDELLIIAYSEESNMVNALGMGAIDLAFDVPISLWDTALGYDNVDGQEARTEALWELGINCASADIRDGFPDPSQNLETTNLSVRRAIAHAVDRAYVVDTVFGGLVEEGETLIPGVSSYWHYDVPDEDEMPYDLEVAADILDAAGYVDSDTDGVRENSTSGVPLEFQFYYIGTTEGVSEVAEMVSEDLSTIGINAVLNPVSEALMWDVWFGCEYDLFIWWWFMDSDTDPSAMLEVMTTDQVPTSPMDFYKWSDSFYSNPYYDALYELQAATTDMAVRQDIVHEMQAILYHDSPYVVLHYPQDLFAYRTDTFSGYPDMATDPAASPWYIRFYLGIVPPYENLPPTAVFTVSPAEGDLATLFSFDASGCYDLHDDVSALEVRWDWENDGVFDTAWSTDKLGYHQFGSVGTHTIMMEVRDTLGLTNWTTRMVTVYDDVAPVTEMLRSVEETEHGWYPENVTVTLVATDDSGEVMYTNYTLDGSGWLEYSAPFLVSGEGEHVIEYFSVDPSMNVEGTHIDSIYIDYTSPALEISLEGDEGSEPLVFKSSVVVTVTSQDDVSDLLTLETSLDGGAWTVYDAPLTVSEEGEHTVEASAVDLANKSAEAEVTFLIDMTAPATEAECGSDPSDEGWYNSSVSVTLAATDALSGVSETWYRVDSGDWVEYDGAISVSGDGEHEVEYYSVDAAGNTEDAGQLSIAIDGTAPTVRMFVLSRAQSSTSGDTVTLTYECLDNTSGIAYSEYSLDGGAFVNAGGGEVVNVLIDSEGDHTITVRVYDAAGNSYSTTYTFHVDGSGDVDILLIAGAIGAAVVIAALVAFMLMRRKKKA